MITYTCTQICITPTLGVDTKTCLPFRIHPKIFYSYTRNEHKNMFDRFLNKCSKFLLISLSKFYFKKKHEAIISKRKEKKEKEERKKKKKRDDGKER
jgi:large-conductance mechanosensitive channel